MSYIDNRQSYDSAGAPTPLLALKIFGYAFLAGIMALFMSFSINMITQSALQEPTAVIINTIEADNSVTKETFTIEEYTAKQAEIQKILTDDTRKSAEYVYTPKNAACAVLVVAVDVIEQLLTLALLVVLTGYYVYREGDRDRNLFKHHDRKPTPYKGLVIGLLAGIPSCIVYALLIVGKCGVMSETVQGLYRGLNPTFLTLINVIMPSDVYPATNIAVWQLVLLALPLAVLPLTCHEAYRLGYNRFFKRLKKKRDAKKTA